MFQPKAPEDWRTPKAAAYPLRPKIREASWTAAVLCRFFFDNSFPDLAVRRFRRHLSRRSDQRTPHYQFRPLGIPPTRDVVLIDWQPKPYHDKWVIGRTGTEKEPITIRGVPGPNGELPIIDGNNAITRPQLKYWGDIRGVIKIGGSSIPALCVPQYIVLENLEIRGGHAPNKFTDPTGQIKSYGKFASALYVEKAQHLTIRHCTLTDSGNGLFIGSNDESASSDITVESCHIYGNGNIGSGQEHNVYTEAQGITYQYNHLGRLRPGAIGNNLKDRSSGLVIRYNWIEGGDKELDLVDAEGSAIIRRDPLYKKTFIYGNVFIKPAGPTHPQVVHYGGDSAKPEGYRKGTLYFYNNTLFSQKADGTTLFWLSSDEERCDCRNNIFYTTGTGPSLTLLRNRGLLELTHNWFKPGWGGAEDIDKPLVRDDGTAITGTAPGFMNESAQDFHLNPQSRCLSTGTLLLPATLPENNVTREYASPQSSRPRKIETKISVGAFETNQTN